MAIQSKQKKVSSDPQKLAAWFARYVTQGMTDIIVRRNNRESSDPLFHISLDLETFSATKTAEETLSFINTDADIVGGNVSYRVTVCKSDGAELATIPVSVETGIAASDPHTGMSAEGAWLTKGVDNLLVKYGTLVTTLQTTVDKLGGMVGNLVDANKRQHDTLIEMQAAHQKAMSEAEDRHIARMKAEWEQRMTEDSVKAIGKVALMSAPSIGRRMGATPDEVKFFQTMARDMLGIEKPAVKPPSQTESIPAGKAALPWVMARVPADAYKTVFEGLSDKQKMKILPHVPEDLRNDFMACIEDPELIPQTMGKFAPEPLLMVLLELDQSQKEVIFKTIPKERQDAFFKALDILEKEA